MKPNLYIIAGCNGAGKTTASMTMLPDMLECYEFINADGIAKCLSPFRPEKGAFEAGRIMLHRIDELLESKVDFAFPLHSRPFSTPQHYKRGINNLLNIYLEISDEVKIIDNSIPNMEMIAEKSAMSDIRILNKEKWGQLTSFENEK